MQAYLLDDDGHSFWFAILRKGSVTFIDNERGFWMVTDIDFEEGPNK